MWSCWLDEGLLARICIIGYRAMRRITLHNLRGVVHKSGRALWQTFSFFFQHEEGGAVFGGKLHVPSGME
jgi:hypothetical protein